MTQVSVTPVGGPVSELRVVPHVRVPRSAAGAPTARPSPVAGWVTDLTVGVLAPVAALLCVALTGVPLEPWLVLVLLAAWPTLLVWQGLFLGRPLGEALPARAGRVLRAGCALGLLSWASAPLVGPAAVPEVMLPATAAMTGATLLATALGGRRGCARVLLVGHADDIHRVARELEGPTGPEVVAGCSAGGLVRSSRFPVREGVESAVGHALRQGADTLLLLPGPGVPPDVVRRLQWQASTFGIGTYLGTGLLDVASFRMSLRAGPGPTLVHVRPSAPTGARRLLKELLERGLAALALLVLAPLLAGVALLVRHDSPGPALFRQERVGRHGRAFLMYKFRTMSCRAEAERDDLAAVDEGAGLLFKIRADPRVTRIGRTLRRYSVDELPQLWNVVAGDMALVGPRPALPEEVARYDVDPRRRLAVKPGLTGLWQVSGRSDLDWEQTVRLDLRYVDNWSLRLDASILLRTVRAVLDHRGAY